MPILEKFNDEELTKLPFLLSKTQVYKLRKGLMTLADVSPDLEDRLRRRYAEVGSELGKPDYNNPDYTDPAFDSYSSRFRLLVAEVGLERAHERWTTGHACGCMGAQHGAPFCPCMMTSLTAERYAKKVIVPTEEGKALVWQFPDGKVV
jgi:hypothetical protein